MRPSSVRTSSRLPRRPSGTSTRTRASRWSIVILDEAQQKGTGKWMSQNSFDVGAPIPTVNAAVEARQISALKAERVAASRVLAGPDRNVSPRDRAAAHRRGAARALRQQDHVVRAGHGAPADGVGRIPLRHRSGRGRQDLARRLYHPRGVARRHPRRVQARPRISSTCSSTNRFATRSVDQRFRTAGASSSRPPSDSAFRWPDLRASLAYYDAYRSARLPANLTQAQRDFFGAHTYRRIDRDGVFHTDWTPGD